jgi:hypothetical protein
MTEALSYKPWALAALSVSNMRAIADHTSELVSQVLMGTPLKILDVKEKWYQVETPEHYLGWMDYNGLTLFSEDEMESWKKSERCVYTCISGFAYSAPGNQGDVVTDLILGDLVEVESEVSGYSEIKLPDGRSGFVRKDDCISFKDWCNLEPDVPALLSVAKQMMGSPYLWGGASSKAVDCSGFTKLVFYTQGLILARDASQQVKYGEHIDIGNYGNLQEGDLLFFGSSAERPGHVGIYLGNGDFIHSSGRVHISSIVPGDPKHVPERIFVAARRIVNSADTEGISQIGSHPWYSSKFRVQN